MVISDEHKYIFVAVPKTGTTSMSSFLLENDPTAVKNVVRVNGKEQNVPEHATALEIRRMLGEKFEEYKTFGFVRNPYSKLLSSYFFYKNGRASRKVKAGQQTFFVRMKVLFAKCLPFTMWAILYPFRSCRSFLVDEQDKLLVDNVGYFESLDKDFEDIVTQLGIDTSSSDLPHLNQTNHDEFSAYIGTGLLKRLLSIKLRSDLSTFYATERASE